MAENPDIDDTDQGRLPPSDIASLASRSDIDLDTMSTEELLTLIEDAIDRLPVPELVTIRNAIEHKRLEHLEEAKNAVLEEIRDVPLCVKSGRFVSSGHIQKNLEKQRYNRRKAC